MKLKWFGQSCFLLTSLAGTRVLMDPFDKKTGYKVPVVEADVVTTSHDYFDHNNVHAVKGNFYHIDQPGTYAHKDIQIEGTLTCHDRSQGARLGSNIVYCFTVDGIRVCHSGDLGHPLTSEQITQIGKVDVLLINLRLLRHYAGRGYGRAQAIKSGDHDPNALSYQTDRAIRAVIRTGR